MERLFHRGGHGSIVGTKSEEHIGTSRELETILILERS
jgi:hypothetical protein